MEENKTCMLCEKFFFYKILSECFLKEGGPVQQTKKFSSHQDMQLRQLMHFWRGVSGSLIFMQNSFQHKFLYTPIRPSSLWNYFICLKDKPGLTICNDNFTQRSWKKSNLGKTCRSFALNSKECEYLILNFPICVLLKRLFLYLKHCYVLHIFNDDSLHPQNLWQVTMKNKESKKDHFSLVKLEN